MLLPKFLLILIVLLILVIGSRYFLRNKFILAVFLIAAVLGILFSDTIYQAFNGKIMSYVQSPQGNRMPFISERWKNADSNNPADNTRQRMSGDLINKYKLLGKTRTEIINLLGESDSTNAFRDWDLKYYLGSESGTAHPQWLVIKFNENDSVDDFNIVRN